MSKIRMKIRKRMKRTIRIDRPPRSKFP